MTEIEEELARASRGLSASGPAPDVLAGLSDRAERDGVLDVAYAQVDSPFGPLTVAASRRGLVRVAYPEHELDRVLERLAADVSPRILAAPARLDPLRAELEGYFAGRVKEFATPIDWSAVHGFCGKVLRATAKIGYGRVRSYAEVAASAGSPKAVRAAGNGLGSNPMPIVVPCHRVVRTGGGLGGYTGGIERKEWLLELEGRTPV